MNKRPGKSLSTAGGQQKIISEGRELKVYYKINQILIVRWRSGNTFI